VPATGSLSIIDADTSPPSSSGSDGAGATSSTCALVSDDCGELLSASLPCAANRDGMRSPTNKTAHRRHLLILPVSKRKKENKQEKNTGEVESSNRNVFLLRINTLLKGRIFRARLSAFESQ